MQLHMPDVSVIVPVYNTSKYLEQCLESLRTQTLDNIEIILIDDGSADNSGQICDNYASLDQRIRVIRKKNEGLSAARNDGLEMAKAPYVMFVDSDDWVEPRFCESPFWIAKNSGAELVAFKRIWHDGNGERRQASFEKEGPAAKKEILTDWWYVTGVIVWNKLYDKKLFEEIRFPVGRLSEDTAVTHHLIQKANEVYLLNEYLYHHRINSPGSITTVRSGRMIEDELGFNLLRMRDLKEWGYVGQEEVEKLALTYLMTLGRNAEQSGLCRVILKDCKRLKNDGISWKYRFVLALYRISPKLFDGFSVLTGRRIKKSSSE